MWEGAGNRTETAIFWPPLLWPSTLCLSRSPEAQPEALGSTLLGADLVWLSLPHHVYNSVSNCNWNCISVLTELYNSSTSTRSPIRSLEWHDWSSSSGNNCHAVHSSLSSGASVYECIMGFTLSHFLSQFPPTRFPLITAIRMCHLLPVHHLGMAFLAGSKAKILHYLIMYIYVRVFLSNTDIVYSSVSYHSYLILMFYTIIMFMEVAVV